MKKSFLVLVLVAVFSSALFASFYDGGPARTIAMGGQQLVPDISNTFDLYDSGFAANILSRPKKSAINIYPQVYITSKKRVRDNISESTNEISGFLAGTGAYDEANNGIVLWLSDDSVITIKPYLSVASIDDKRSSNSSDPYTRSYLTPFLAGEVEYAFKIGDTLGMAALLGYSRDGLYMSRDYDLDTYELSFDKLNFQVSMSFLPGRENNDWSFGLSVGNKTEILRIDMLDFSMNPDMIELMYMAFPLTLNSIQGNDYSDYTLTEEWYSIDHNAFGVLTAFGAHYKGEGATEFLAKLGVIAGYTLNTTYENKTKVKATGVETTDKESYTRNEGGLGLDTSLVWRGDLGAVIPGISVDYRTISFDTKNSSGNVTSNESYSKLQTDMGVSFRLGESVMIPLEFMYDNMLMIDREPYNKDNYYMQYFISYGGKLGTEIGINDGMAIRFGFDYTVFGSHSIEYIGGEIDDQSNPMGTDENRNMTVLGLNLGMGFKGDASETNIGLRFEGNGDYPTNDEYKEKSDMNFKIYSDIKFFLD
jgi:hypothetical protein